jgi:hypothetical protein
MKLILLLDGTSTVTFMPYIALNFYKEYLIPNYIGESLAALIPSALSLIQSFGQDPGCFNYTDPALNQTQLIPGYPQPTYSVSVFFLFMFALLCASTASFTMLNYSKLGKRESDKKKSLDALTETTLQIANELETLQEKQALAKIFREKLVLWSQVFILSFFFYGFLPGLQSYSTLPYSKYFLFKEIL